MISGTFRVYFNRHGAAPLLWCVAPSPNTNAGAWPRWEIAVRLVSFASGCSTGYSGKATPDDEDGRPSAWLEGCGTLTIDETGHAVIQ